MNAPAEKSESRLILHPLSHEYSYAGVQVPGVTNILKSCGMTPDFGNTRAAQRGTHVHKMLELYDNGEITDVADWNLTPAMLGYLSAWKSFLASAPIEIIANEESRFHEIWRYAGTPDRVLRWRDGFILIDIKTGGKYGYYTLQTAAYAMLVEQDGITLNGRGCLYLSEDGAWSWEPHESPDDADDFLAALRVYRWRKGKKLIPGEAKCQT